MAKTYQGNRLAHQAAGNDLTRKSTFTLSNGGSNRSPTIFILIKQFSTVNHHFQG
jgi:hypothetical protein